MPAISPVLDHVVIDVRDRMEEAAARFAALGFQLTPRGRHTLGSINHLAMFATDYFELLGFGEDGGMRPELAGFPVGLNGLVFKTADADAAYRQAAAAGLPVLPAQAFSRPVTVAGATRDARFRTTRLDPAKVAMGRVYFCEHRTPDLVWRPEWQTHPNGARAILRVVIASPEPRRSAALFRALFGDGCVAEAQGRTVMTAGRPQIELMTPAAVAAEFGPAAADPAGRPEYLAALGFEVASLSRAAELLRAVPAVRIETGKIVVPASAACNATLVFSE